MAPFLTKKNMKKIVKTIINALFGLVAIAFFFALFVVDRFVLLFLPHLDSPAIDKFWMNRDLVKKAVTRIIVALFMILMYKLLKWLIW